MCRHGRATIVVGVTAGRLGWWLLLGSSAERSAGAAAATQLQLAGAHMCARMMRA